MFWFFLLKLLEIFLSILLDIFANYLYDKYMK